MYPKVKVRVEEEEEEEDNHLPPSNDSESFPFLRLNECLSEQEKENQFNSPPSIPRITKAYVTSPATKSLSASKVSSPFIISDVGRIENHNNKQIGKNTKSSNTKANLVPPPRAVLSSPDNDGMIGSRNKLNCARSAMASKKRPTPSEQIKAEVVVGQAAHIKVKLSGDITQSCPNNRKLGSKSENRGLARGRTRKDPLKPIVQRQKTHIGDEKSS